MGRFAKSAFNDYYEYLQNDDDDDVAEDSFARDEPYSYRHVTLIDI